MTKPTVAANAAGLPPDQLGQGDVMSARGVAIGMALQGLEPAVLDLARMSHLVSEHAESTIGRIEGDAARLAAADADALLFGVYDLDRRIRELRDSYEKAFDQAPST